MFRKPRSRDGRIRSATRSFSTTFGLTSARWCRLVAAPALIAGPLSAPIIVSAQSLGKQARVRQSTCQVAGGKPENANTFYSLIWSADQDLLIVNDNKRLYFDKVLKVETVYPFDIVYAATKSNTTLIARFVVPNYRPTGDAKYPQEQVVSRDQRGFTSTDMCGVGE